MGKFEEYNVFVQIGKIFIGWRESSRRHRAGFCPRSKEGYHMTSLQIPHRTLARVMIILAILYLALWLIDLGYGLLESYLWSFWGFTAAGVSVILIVALGLRLRIRYTLTDTELIVRRLGTRRYDLMDLKQANLAEPPLIKPGQKIRFITDGGEYLTLRRLRTMEGGTHFVMLLSGATGLNFIERFLGLETAKEPAYEFGAAEQKEAY